MDVLSKFKKRNLIELLAGISVFIIFLFYAYLERNALPGLRNSYLAIAIMSLIPTIIISKDLIELKNIDTKSGSEINIYIKKQVKLLESIHLWYIGPLFLPLFSSIYFTSGSLISKLISLLVVILIGGFIFRLNRKEAQKLRSRYI